MVSEPAAPMRNRISRSSAANSTTYVQQTSASERMTARNATKALKIGWIGAGSINFGSLEGPWNHAARLQKQNGVQFTAIVEPNLDLARVRFATLFVPAMGRLASASPGATVRLLLLCYREELKNIRQGLFLRNGKIARYSRTTEA